MALNGLGSNVSKNDKEKINERRTKEYADGFEDTSGGLGGGDDSFDFTFDDLEFGDGGDGGSSGGSSSSFGGNSFGDSSFGGGSSNGSVLDGWFGNSGQQQQQQQQAKPDLMDTAVEKVGEAGTAFAHVFRDMVKGFKSRTASDWGKYFRNLIIVAVCLLGGALLTGVIGAVSNIGGLKFSRLPLQLLVSSFILAGCAFPGIAIVAHIKSHSPQKARSNNQSQGMPEYNFSADDSDEDGLSFSDDGLDFSDDDDEEIDLGPTADEPSGMDLLDSLETPEPEEVDFDRALGNVQERVPVLSRPYLVDTFRGFFGTCTPQFSDRREIVPGTDDFAGLEAICIKAIAAAAKKDIDELKDCQLEEAHETFFAYELKVTRYKNLTKTDDIAKEVAAYSKKSPDDNGVSASVSILGDFYLIKIFKGVKALITLGDIFKKQEAIDYFKDEKHTLPYIVGVKVDGSVIYTDAKKIESMLVVGRPRYGKSWFVVNIIANLCLFNKPEDVQFIIVDPKRTTMFKTIGMLPHVVGVHDNSHILDLMRDLINGEGRRREKLLAENKCDTIWDLRERKGIKLPVLYFFMDEVITIKGELDKDEKVQFDDYTKTIITKFPYIGIRLIMVSHRAQGVVDKTVREQIGFRVAVGAKNDVVLEALGLKSFDTALEKPGEAAVLMDGLDGEYIRGNAIMSSDNENVEFFKSAARAFYKMGFDTVDCSSLGCCYNRDEDEIRKELLEDGTNHVQIDF